MDMDKHLTVLGIIYISFGALSIMGAIVFFALITGGGFISGDPVAIRITSLIGMIIGGFLILISLPGIIGGIGILNRYYWAKIVLLVVGCLHLPGIPFGTALGIYTIWVLMNNETDKYIKKP